MALFLYKGWYNRIKTGFDRPLGHIRAGAPIYKGARPNSCGRPPKSGKTPFLSLLIPVSPHVSKYLFPLFLLILMPVSYRKGLEIPKR